MIGNNLLLGSGDEGYNLTRSLRTRASASAYLSRTPASAGNQKTWTYSDWIKRGALGTDQVILSAGQGAGTLYFYLRFLASNALDIFTYDSNTATFIWQLTTTQVFRDPSAWYHLVISTDTTQATAANRVKIYVNGTQVTAFTTASYPSLNYDTRFNANIAHYISSYIGSANFADCYQTEINSVDGQALTPSSFGSTNSVTGVWQPAAYTGTYGTNGFELQFTDNSAATAAAIGKDSSGNGNNWTPNNISVTAGVTYDSMTDVPTLTSATAANFCTWNPLLNSSYTTLSNGNLTSVGNTSTDSGLNVGTIGVSSGKWYWEATIQGLNGTSVYPRLGFLCNIPANGNGSMLAITATLGLRYVPDGTIYKNANVLVGTYATFTTNDVISFALDVDSLTCGVYKNNTLQTTVTGLTLNNQFFPANVPYDGGNLSANFGQRPFVYTPPTGYLAINTYNLPTSTIVKGNTVMDATLYTGTGASLSVTNTASFKPDLVWVKSRSAATDHAWYDSVRGTTKQLESNTTTAETTEATGLTTFGSAGFTVGALAQMNTSAATYVGWQWQAGQGSSSSNTNGTITSTVSVNASAGFSVVTYTGTGANATVGHGLGVAPRMYIVKRRNGAVDWGVYHSSLTSPAYGLYLNTTNAQFSAPTYWNSTAPTSSVFSIGTDSLVNASGATMVAYCWTPIAGYSAFGSYTGNGSTDGVFVYTGFRPKFVIIKRTDTTGDWYTFDAVRSPYNATQQGLSPNSSDAETTYTGWGDLLSNGFKIRRTDGAWNASGGGYIYMAFAENPLKNSLAR
jgi:hypothetical protein